MTEVRIQCPCCRGAGTVELTGEYLETLKELLRLGREITGAELGRLMGVKPTAMNNRLARLEEIGVAVSRRWGRRRLYRAVEGARE